MKSWLASKRATRSGFIGIGIATGSLIANPSAISAPASDLIDEILFLPGTFQYAIDARSAVVSAPVKGSFQVNLESNAFIVHGFDGEVATLEAFVENEEVVLRGRNSDDSFQAIEFQSLYESVSGSLSSEDDGPYLRASSSRRIFLSPELARAVADGKKPPQREYHGLAWTNPRTRESKVVSLWAKGPL